MLSPILNTIDRDHLSLTLELTTPLISDFTSNEKSDSKLKDSKSSSHPSVDLETIKLPVHTDWLAVQSKIKQYNKSGRLEDFQTLKLSWVSYIRLQPPEQQELLYPIYKNLLNIERCFIFNDWQSQQSSLKKLSKQSVAYLDLFSNHWSEKSKIGIAILQLKKNLSLEYLTRLLKIVATEPNQQGDAIFNLWCCLEMLASEFGRKPYNIRSNTMDPLEDWFSKEKQQENSSDFPLLEQKNLRKIFPLVNGSGGFFYKMNTLIAQFNNTKDTQIQKKTVLFQKIVQLIPLDTNNTNFLLITDANQGSLLQDLFACRHGSLIQFQRLIEAPHCTGSTTLVNSKAQNIISNVLYQKEFQSTFKKQIQQQIQFRNLTEAKITLIYWQPNNYSSYFYSLLIEKIKIFNTNGEYADFLTCCQIIQTWLLVDPISFQECGGGTLLTEFSAFIEGKTVVQQLMSEQYFLLLYSDNKPECLQSPLAFTIPEVTLTEHKNLKRSIDKFNRSCQENTNSPNTSLWNDILFHCKAWIKVDYRGFQQGFGLQLIAELYTLDHQTKINSILQQSGFKDKESQWDRKQLNQKPIFANTSYISLKQHLSSKQPIVTLTAHRFAGKVGSHYDIISTELSPQLQTKTSCIKIIKDLLGPFLVEELKNNTTFDTKLFETFVSLTKAKLSSGRDPTITIAEHRHQLFEKKNSTFISFCNKFNLNTFILAKTFFLASQECRSKYVEVNGIGANRDNQLEDTLNNVDPTIITNSKMAMYIIKIARVRGPAIEIGMNAILGAKPGSISFLIGDSAGKPTDKTRRQDTETAIVDAVIAGLFTSPEYAPENASFTKYERKVIRTNSGKDIDIFEPNPKGQFFFTSPKPVWLIKSDSLTVGSHYVDISSRTDSENAKRTPYLIDHNGKRQRTPQAASSNSSNDGSFVNGLFSSSNPEFICGDIVEDEYGQFIDFKKRSDGQYVKVMTTGEIFSLGSGSIPIIPDKQLGYPSELCSSYVQRITNASFKLTFSPLFYAITEKIKIQILLDTFPNIISALNELENLASSTLTNYSEEIKTESEDLETETTYSRLLPSLQQCETTKEFFHCIQNFVLTVGPLYNHLNFAGRGQELMKEVIPEICQWSQINHNSNFEQWHIIPTPQNIALIKTYAHEFAGLIAESLKSPIKEMRIRNKVTPEMLYNHLYNIHPNWVHSIKRAGTFAISPFKDKNQSDKSEQSTNSSSSLAISSITTSAQLTGNLIASVEEPVFSLVQQPIRSMTLYEKEQEAFNSGQLKTNKFKAMIFNCNQPKLTQITGVLRGFFYKSLVHRILYNGSGLRTIVRTTSHSLEERKLKKDPDQFHLFDDSPKNLKKLRTAQIQLQN